MKVGEAIQCWSAKECTHRMMELAAKGIVTEEQPKGSMRLVVIEVPPEEG